MCIRDSLAALDRPTAGEVLLEGKPLSAIRERDLAAFRRSHLGFVFQDFNLLDTFSLQDNIYLPLVLAGTDYRAMQKKLRPIADQLGIKDILTKYPYEAVSYTHLVIFMSVIGEPVSTPRCSFSARWVSTSRCHRPSS